MNYQMAADEFEATGICPTCQGEGWLRPPLGDGDVCPTCDGAPVIIGGTGRVRLEKKLDQ